MMRKVSLFFVAFLFVLYVFGFPTSSHARESNGTIMVDDSNVYEQTKYYQDNLLGVAGGFHLVGLDSVKNNVHVNGNILTDKLIYGSDFGTSDVEEVSYIKQFECGSAINTTSHVDSILVVGRDVELDLVDNGQAWSINGYKVDAPNKQNSPNHLWQDGEREFIDLNKVKQDVIQLVNDLSMLDNNTSTINNKDWNKQELIVATDNQFNVYNVALGDLDFSKPIDIKGFNKDKASTLIINVDMSQMEDQSLFTIPKSIAHYTDGSQVSIGHVTNWSNANVVWNVYDSSNEKNIYTGTIKNLAAVTGSIISPGATVILDHNLNGTVVAKDIVVNGETHRDDYTESEDPDPTEPKTVNIAVEKVWEGSAQEYVTIHLLADGEVVDTIELSEVNDWKHVFTDLPVETDKGEILYSVEEVAIAGYETTITGNKEDGFTVTNTEIEEQIVNEPAPIDITVEKVWKGSVQEYVTIHLLADGEVVDTIDLSEANDWKHVFTDLPVETDRGEILYSVEEVAIAGYETTITGNKEDGFTVTNTEIEEQIVNEPAPIDITVEKVWEGNVQEQVTIHLLADGEVVDTIDLSEANDWKHVFTDLPVETDRGEILYSVEEVAIAGYETTITGNKEDGFTVTNTEIERSKPITGTAKKIDANDENEHSIMKAKDTRFIEESAFLPKTATHTFNYLWIGLGLILTGGLSYFILGRRRWKS